MDPASLTREIKGLAGQLMSPEIFIPLRNSLVCTIVVQKAMCISSYDFPENHFLCLDKQQLKAHPAPSYLSRKELRQKEANEVKAGRRQRCGSIHWFRSTCYSMPSTDFIYVHTHTYMYKCVCVTLLMDWQD